MLPKSYRQAYHTWVKSLLTLQEQLYSPTPDVAMIEQTFQQVQQIFTAQILPLNSQEINLDIASRWQSIQTEIHRSLRLLATDILFLRTSKQSTSVRAKLTTISDRLCRLMEYCQLMEKGLTSE